MSSQAEVQTRAFDGHAPFEALLAELSSRFINLGPGEVDREVEEALRRVCQALAIDYAVLWQWTAADPALILPTHAYPELKAPAASEPPRPESFPWVVERIRAGRAVVVSRLEDLPEEAAADRESARSIGIVSNLTLPLSLGGRRPWARWPSAR